MKKKYNSLNDSKRIKKRLALSCGKKLPTSLRGKASKHHVDFYCLSSFFEKRNKLKPHEKICETKDFCGIVMQSEKNNILKFNQYMKSDKMPYIIYTDIESKNEKYR